MALRVFFSKKPSLSKTSVLRNLLSPFTTSVQHLQVDSTEVKEGTTSALFVSGNKASSTFSVLSPYLDFTKRFQNMHELEANIKMRGMSTSVRQLADMWAELNRLKLEKTQLESEKLDIARTMKSLAKSKDVNQMKKYKDRGKEIREMLKSISQRLWDLEEIAVIGALQLPNVLHKSTQVHNKQRFTLFEKPKFDFKAKSHIELGKINGVLEFVDTSPSAYYLKKQLAVLELACSDYFLKAFKCHGYLLQSNPDFSKGVVVEGSSVKVDKNSFFALASHESDTDQNLQYLVGGASLQAQVAYLTKQVINNPMSLPQKIVSLGRQYSPTSSTKPGLLNVAQSTAINALVLFEGRGDEEELLLNEILMVMVQCYSRLKLHFRLIHCSAERLEPQESAAIGLELYSPYTEEYHEVGRISVYGDFISRRLWSMCKVSQKSANFLSMIHVKVCYLSRFLALVMENGQKIDGTYDLPVHLRALVDEL